MLIDPRVTVLSTRFFTGLDTLTVPNAQYAQVMTLSKALTTRFASDAHFCCYEVPGEEVWPRLNKPVLHEIRQGGGNVTSQVIALDYDNEDHGPWTNKTKEQFAEKLYNLADTGNPYALNWRACYLTKNGARLVYLLTHPVPVDQQEPLTRGIIKRFRDDGLLLDDSCSDWTRLFRLPWVERDGILTWEGSEDGIVPPVTMMEFPEHVLDLAMIKPEGKSLYSQASMPVQELDLPQPTPQQVQDELYVPETGKASDWNLRCKKLLRGATCYEAIYEGKPLAEPGSRHKTIHKAVGECCNRLFLMDGITPEKIYALLYKPVSDFIPDMQTRDWTRALWQAVLSVWQKELGKEAARQHEIETQKAGAALVLQRIREGMRQWSTAAELALEDEYGDHWLRQRLIFVNTKGHGWIINRDGQVHFDCITSRDVFPVLIKQHGLQQAIPIERLSNKGYIPIPVNEILKSHARLISAVEYHCSPIGNSIKDIDGKYPIVRLVPYERRKDLTPTYSAYVDQWLQYLFGEHYDIAVAWLAWALAIEEGPICALSVRAAPGVGKKMLAQGLAECFTHGKCAGDRVFTRFNDELLDSPIIHINEGMPKMPPGGASIADTFRKLVGGDGTKVEAKFSALVYVTIPFRILITANNAEVIATLSEHRDLSIEDQQALGQRLLHYNLGPEAAHWLKSKGGAKFTAGWIAGDAGDPSDFTVAKHFMWLHAMRKYPSPGSRFLVEGTADGIVQRMATSSGSAPIVIEILVDMLERNNGQCLGLAYDEVGSPYMTTMGVVRRARDDVFNQEHLNHRNVGSVMGGLVTDDSPKKPTTMKDSGMRQSHQARWHKVDIRKLLYEAVQHGYAHTNLRAIVEKVYGPEMIPTILSGES